MSIDNISKNIKSLRIAYGETQMDLALAIGLDSPASIANYEKGSRTPKPNVRKKIATHYLITEDELAHGDFSKLEVISIPFDDTARMQKIATAILPIICTDNALDDSMFKKGYQAHIRILKDIEAGKEFDDNDLDTCMNSYNESYESNKTIEPAANILWWAFYIGIAIVNMRIVEGLEELRKKKIDNSVFLKSFYLPALSDDDSSEDEVQRRKERQEYIEGIEEEFVKYFHSLKASNPWSDLAYYYCGT